MKKQLYSVASIIIFGFILGMLVGIPLGKRMEKVKKELLYQERQEFFQVGDIKLTLYLDSIEADYEEIVLEIVRNFTKEIGKSLSKAKAWQTMTPLKELNQRFLSSKEKKPMGLSSSRPSIKD